MHVEPCSNLSSEVAVVESEDFHEASESSFVLVEYVDHVHLRVLVVSQCRPDPLSLVWRGGSELCPD